MKKVWFSNPDFFPALERHRKPIRIKDRDILGKS